MSYQIIAEHQGEGAGATMGQALEVSVSGDYAWRTRRPRIHEQRDGELLAHIRAAYEASRGLYGSPRIHAALRAAGICGSRQRVARLMRQAGIHSPHADHRQSTQPPRRAEPEMGGDILGIWTDAGWPYLAALLDAHSRRIVGGAMRASRDEARVPAALRRALGHRQVGGTLPTIRIGAAHTPPTLTWRCCQPPASPSV